MYVIFILVLIFFQIYSWKFLLRPLRGADLHPNAHLTPGGLHARLLADGDGREQVVVGRHNNCSGEPSDHYFVSPRTTISGLSFEMKKKQS